MKSAIKKFENQVTKNTDKIKGGSNGKGTKNATSGAGQTQQTQLL